MTLAKPGLIADTTSTSGVGTYTLTGVTSGGYRSLANAVAAGHAADGQTVYYSVRDTTTSGGSLNFEIGIGTIGGSGTTLARTTISESSNSDLAVSWGAGGSRQVLIAIGAQGLAILTAANAFSGNNTFGGTSTFNGAVTSTQDVTVDKAGSTAVLNVRSDQSTGAPARLRLGGHNSAAANIDYLIFQSVIVDNTAASEDGRGDLLLYAAGSQITTHRFNNDGSITNVVAGTKFDNFASGTTTDFYQAAAPTGWTRVTTGVDGCAVRLVTGGSPGTATTAGRSDVGTATVTVATANLPAHSHGLNSHTHQLAYTVSNAGGGGTTGFRLHTDNLGTVGGADTTSGPTPTSTGNTGSGSALSLNLRVADFLLASKD